MLRFISALSILCAWAAAWPQPAISDVIPNRTVACLNVSNVFSASNPTEIGRVGSMIFPNPSVLRDSTFRLYQYELEIARRCSVYVFRLTPSSCNDRTSNGVKLFIAKSGEKNILYVIDKSASKINSFEVTDKLALINSHLRIEDAFRAKYSSNTFFMGQDLKAIVDRGHLTGRSFGQTIVFKVSLGDKKYFLELSQDDVSGNSLFSISLIPIIPGISGIMFIGPLESCFNANTVMEK